MIERTIEKEVIKSIKNRPVVLITGARQVGKSTLCFKLKRELGFNYVSLDDLRLREQAKSDPELFLETHKWPLIIDEVQNAPELFDAIEAIVNKKKLENGSNYGMYVLTSSLILQNKSYSSSIIFSSAFKIKASFSFKIGLIYLSQLARVCFL